MPSYHQTYHRIPRQSGSHHGGRSSSVVSTPTGQGMLPAGGGPVSAHTFPYAYAHPSSHIGASQVHTMPGFASSSTTPSNTRLYHWSGNNGPSFASTSAPTDTLPMWPTPPVGNTSQFPYNSEVNQVHTAPHVFPSPSRQDNVYPQPLAPPEHIHPQAVAQPRPLPISRYSTLSMALSMPAPQHQAAGQNHSSHNVGVTQNHSESVNYSINLGHGTVATVLGTVNAAEGMILVPNGLTETPESLHPTIQAQAAPTDHTFRNTPNVPTSSAGPSRKRPLTCASNNNTLSTSALPLTVPQSSPNKRPRGDTADPCTSAPDQTSSKRVRFHTLIVHAPTVPSSQGPPVRATFAVERPATARKLEQAFEREEASNVVLKDWNRINKELEAGMDVCFTGYIKSRDQFDDVSTKLLHCLETNCPSKCRFTRSSTLKNHVKRHYTTSGTPMDGETRKSPSFMARAKEKGEAKLGEAEYVDMIKKYKSLKDMVNNADKP